VTPTVDRERDKNERRAVGALLNFLLSRADAEQCEIAIRGSYATLRLPSRILIQLLSTHTQETK
jgi:hypothetical protein